MRSLLLAFLASVLYAAGPQITLNSKEYFEAPGFSFLLFHNTYRGGYQDGLQMIQQDERLLDSGDLYLIPAAGVADTRHLLRRVVDPSRSTATVYAEQAWLGYQLICRTDGTHIFITLKLDHPIDWTRIEQAGFHIYLFPGAYYSKSFQGESGSGVFPRPYVGTMLASGTRVLRIAQEDRLRSFTIRRDGGALELIDNRQADQQLWYSVNAPIAKGSAETEVHLEIVPTIDPAWRRPPVLGISQAGYQPDQPKRMVIELDPRDHSDSAATLWKLELSGDRKAAYSAIPKPWGKFLRYDYAVFDFSQIRDPGMYLVEYRGQTAGPFPIDAHVYDKTWEPTLEYFLPIQMCHVAVREGRRTWHGACHLDDALQAPAHTEHIDNYHEGTRDTRFADNEHIPGLDRGGWHDAGDHDLAGGNIAATTLALALAQEEFRPAIDETTVRPAQREVLLHVPDGRSDMIEQIENGVEGLLAGYRASGHVFLGIIESSVLQYSHLGDPVNITDNRIYDGKQNLKRDDRWAFTTRNTGLQYMSVQAFAAAARVMKEESPALAKEALDAARTLWDYEQTHTAVYAPNDYAPRDSGFRAEEIAAAAEMLITTGEARYRGRLLALLPQFRSISGEQFESIRGAALVRALPAVPNAEFRSAVVALAKKWKAVEERQSASNPYGVPFSPGVSSPEFKLVSDEPHDTWGQGEELQRHAMQAFYFHKHLPDLFGKDMVFNVVDYVLGCHPADNRSLVSAVGTRAILTAYGFNRADWSHIPGGVSTGASFIGPDFMEMKDFPFLWYQMEYAINYAATYIFDVLAAQKLAGEAR
jgi:hypothetical protein